MFIWENIAFKELAFKRHLQLRYFSILIHLHFNSQSQCLFGPQYSAMSRFKPSFSMNTVVLSYSKAERVYLL